MSEVSVSRVSRALWGSSVLYSSSIIHCHFLSVFPSLLGKQSSCSSLQCSPHSSSPSFVVTPAFCYPLPHSSFKSSSFAVQPPLLALLCCALLDNGGIPKLGWKEGASESWPLNDSHVWGWLLGLCPSAKENGGNPERWSSGGGAVRASFMCKSFGNFQTGSFAERRDTLATQQSDISPCYFWPHTTVLKIVSLVQEGRHLVNVVQSFLSVVTHVLSLYHTNDYSYL